VHAKAIERATVCAEDCSLLKGMLPGRPGTPSEERQPARPLNPCSYLHACVEPTAAHCRI